MFNSLRTCLLQNYLNRESVFTRRIAYQFKIDKPIYYPNRQMEMKQIEEQQKSQLIAEPEKKKPLSKDYYYKILGVPKNASIQEIKTAFYALAKRYHPDSLNSANAQQISKRFQEISNAYNVLTDEMARIEDDECGEIKSEDTLLNRVSASGNKILNTTTNKLKEFMGFNNTIMKVKSDGIYLFFFFSVFPIICLKHTLLVMFSITFIFHHYYDSNIWTKILLVTLLNRKYK